MSRVEPGGPSAPVYDPAVHPSLAADLRDAMRGFASSVTIITVGDGEARHAMAATSVSVLSMDPPSMLICVNRSASLYPALLRGAGFAVNLPMRPQEEVARLCSGGAKGEQRFERGDFAMDEDGIPLLIGAQACIVCAQDGRYLYGTHAVIFGKVKKVIRSASVDPLIYFNGCYQALPLSR